MNDDRTNLGQQVARDVREFFKEKVYRTVIPRNVRLAEAPSHGLPAVTYDAQVARSRGVPRARARSARKRTSMRPARDRSTHGDRRPALGKGLSALIPDAPETSRHAARRRSRSTSICSSRTTISRARTSMTSISTSWRSRSKPTASSSRSSSRRTRRTAVSDHRRRAALARGATRRPAQGAGRHEGYRPATTSSGGSRWRSSRTSSARISIPIEEAHAYQRLVTEFGLTQEDVAAQVGKDRSSVANTLRLLRLPDEVRAEVASGRLSMGHARAIVSLTERRRSAPASPVTCSRATSRSARPKRSSRRRRRRDGNARASDRRQEGRPHSRGRRAAAPRARNSRRDQAARQARRRGDRVRQRRRAATHLRVSSLTGSRLRVRATKAQRRGPYVTTQIDAYVSALERNG